MFFYAHSCNESESVVSCVFCYFFSDVCVCGVINAMTLFFIIY